MELPSVSFSNHCLSVSNGYLMGRNLGPFHRPADHPHPPPLPPLFTPMPMSLHVLVLEPKARLLDLD
jgi:hypothetical protein